MSNRAVTWGISNFEKIKKLGFFSIANPVLSYFQYKFPNCFTSKLRKKGKQGNKKKSLIRKKRYSPGLELMTPGSRGQRSNHFAMEDSRFGKSIFPIYRQSIFIIISTRTKLGQGSRNSLSVCLHINNTRSSVEKNVETVKTS